MYTIYCDGSPIYDPRVDAYSLISPKVTLADSAAGSLDFTITAQHPNNDKVNKLTSIIQVLDDGVEIFSGRIIEESGDFYKRRTCHCEGELAYLNDTTQDPKEYHNMTVRGFLETLLNIHNSKVPADKQFKVGTVTVTDNNDSLYRYTNFETTLTCINEKLVKSLGGHLRIRKENGIRYLDYLKDSPNTNTQVIRFGENLLDFSKNFDMAEIATVVIPRGARKEEKSDGFPEALDEYVTIESVNNGKNYLVSQEAVNNYGWIEKVVSFDDVNVPANLKTKGQAYLNDVQFENMVLEIKAIDLHRLDVDIERIKVLDSIRVQSQFHGLDRYFPVVKLMIPLDKPSGTTLTLGTSVKQTLTAATQQTNSSIINRIEAIPPKGEILKEAQENATQLIHSATNGHVVTTADEQLIMDTDDKETATKVWRWNLNGLGYSNTGYNGKFGTAITMDGTIVGERLIAGSVKASALDSEYTSEVERNISAAELNAEKWTNEQLKNYPTKTQVSTAITNTKDSVLLSAKETATAYTDNRLKSYSTSAQIKVTTDSITSEVNKKVNNSEWSTKIRQSATDIRIAWNNISQYIQFEYGTLAIYDGSVSTSKKRAVFDQNGDHFWRDGYYLGKIGTNNLSTDSSKKGLTFDMESKAAFMSWSSKNTDSDSVYWWRLCYTNKQITTNGTTYTANTLHAGCDFDMHWHELKNARMNGVSVKYNNTWYNGFTGNIPIVTKMYSNGNWEYSTLRVVNGIIVGYWN